ncbi:T9SS type A sorting domain-containing protein [Reichenbachiella carrageenanivorans]|uniref:T9SS type A sorting domain-containing protein n=1 Tax=Reichenbachiella carrageenanivorans TaxID=2979869 RepID=A0ABY6D4E6_9BACT|nr:T9SS type A sorting domain-containing protein [Reichenbachiella carrageenanivorans]UXX81027.1 T9SS type A sorting domain-containing protein [Reichenbachiella carrageenanivorans]
MNTTKLRMTVFAVLLHLVGFSQPSNWGDLNRWESLNPGGGGQIQDIYFDQNVEGRIWFSSDMEGVYRSDDSGQSWKFVSQDLSHGMAFVIAQEVNGNKTYQGGLHGAHFSTNAGASNHHNVTWDLIPETKGDAIASIAISPDKQTVVLAPGWQNKDPQKGQGSLIDPIQNLTTDKFNGGREVYVSTDAGQTWNTRTYESQDGYRNVFGVSIHPTNGNIYLGSGAGVYVSTNNGTSFSRISDPSQALGDAGNAVNISKRPDGGSRGVGLSPDGKYIYAVYQTVADASYSNKRWAVFAAKTSTSGITGGWQMIMNGLSDEAEWYDPKVDPRSTASQHRLMIGTVWNGNQNRVGLWEATVNIDGSNNITSHVWQEILNMPKNGRCFDFEPSWERRDFIVRAYDYTPTSWSSHEIISMGGMNVFIGDATGADFPCSSWNEVYGEVISYQDGLAMSHERGFTSTYCYDVDAYGSYMIQGNADHGILQSLDNGYSWTAEHGPTGITNSMSVLTIPVTPALVLADMRKGYGAPNQAVGGLYAKVIDENSIGVKEDWKLVGGEVPNTQGTNYGLPSRNYRALIHDPNIPQRVYVSTRGKSGVAEGGIYMTDDIVAVYNGTGTWSKITPSDMDYRDLRDIWVDPNNSNYVYARSAGSGNSGSLYRGVRSGNNYTWTNMESDCRNASDLYVWNKSGQTWLVAAAQINGDYAVYVNQDPQNSNWNSIASWIDTGMDVAKSLTLRPEKWVESNDPVEFSGLAAHDNMIVTTTFVGNHKKGLGAFMGILNNDGTASWTDWSLASGNNRLIENPTGLQAKVKIENGKPYYYVALATTGAWRRQMSGCGVSATKTSHNFPSSGGSTTITITSPEAFTVSDNQGFINTSLSGQVLTITATPNSGSSARSGEVTVSGCSTTIIQISQDGTGSTGGSSGMEDFNNMPSANQWSDGTFTGNDAIEWSYFQVKRTSSINGNTIKLDNSANGTVSATITGGLTAISLMAAPTGTGSPSGVEIIVDGVVLQSFAIDNGAAPQLFEIQNLDIQGAFNLSIKGFNNSDVQIDDISWTGNIPTTYTLNVTNGSGSGDYLAGTSVNVSANAAPSGQVFDVWTGGVSILADKFSANTTLTMPTNGVNITATYKIVTSTNGGMEDFSNMPTANQWVNGSYIGNNGIVWEYTQAKRTNAINSYTIKLDNNNGGELSANIGGGIGDLTFQAAPTGTANTSGVEVFVNGTSIGTEEISIATTETVTFSNINVSGTFELVFKGYNNADIQIDDISWTSNSGARIQTTTNKPTLHQISLYPNPMDHYVKLNTPNTVELSIYNTYGQLVLRQFTNADGKVDVSHLKKGLYIAKIEGTSFKLFKK